jgi:outer membrane protein assembly factor BamD (BamD/ComL family)
LRNQLARKEVMIAYDYILWKYYTSAKLYAEGILKEYPDTEAALEARFIIAQVNLKTGALDEALNELTLLMGQDLPEKLKAKVIEEMEKTKAKLHVEKP